LVDNTSNDHHTANKTLSDFDEFIVIPLRKTLLLSLDDLLLITPDQL